MSLVLIPRLLSSGFVEFFFRYHYNLLINGTKKVVHSSEGTERCPVLCGSEIWVILCVIVENINNMLLCIKIMLICACVMY